MGTLGGALASALIAQFMITLGLPSASNICGDREKNARDLFEPLLTSQLYLRDDRLHEFDHACANFVFRHEAGGHLTDGLAPLKKSKCPVFYVSLRGRWAFRHGTSTLLSSVNVCRVALRHTAVARRELKSLKPPDVL